MITDTENKNDGLEEAQTERGVRSLCLPKVGITHGDTNGIGYELIMKTFAESSMMGICVPVVYGSSKIAAYHRKALDMNVNFHNITSVGEAEEGLLNLLDCCEEEVKVTLGQPDSEGGRAALSALERAVEDLKAGRIDVLVTAPVNKAAIQCDDFRFSGHTEYLSDRLGGEGDEPLMILANDRMKVALVTTHQPLSQVAESITEEQVERKIRLFNRSLRHDFLLSAPRIAVLALNPHAGDAGLLGTEEKDSIAPAVQAAFDSGIQCFGPYPADGFFGAGHYRHFDGVLAMYHDQGLVPFKALSMDDGVNFTAGLPYVRTSPDHGTAYDIAGKGTADENSFRQAVYMAIDVYRNRLRDDEACAHPLKKQYHERREDGDRHRYTTQEKAE